MELYVAVDKKTRTGLYLASEDLIDKYVEMGYTVYLEHADGTYEKVREPINEEETENQNGSDEY